MQRVFLFFLLLLLFLALAARATQDMAQRIEADEARLCLSVYAPAWVTAVGEHARLPPTRLPLFTSALRAGHPLAYAWRMATGDATMAHMPAPVPADQLDALVACLTLGHRVAHVAAFATPLEEAAMFQQQSS